jgi:uncharacterized membrane protein
MKDYPEIFSDFSHKVRSHCLSDYICTIELSAVVVEILLCLYWICLLIYFNQLGRVLGMMNKLEIGIMASVEKKYHHLAT